MVGLILILAVLLGIMMYSVDSEEDADSILSAFSNTDNLVKRPISVEEVMRQVEQLDKDDASGSSPTTPNPVGGSGTGTGGGGSSGGGKEGDTTPPPTEGETAQDKKVSGTLQYIPQYNLPNSPYIDVHKTEMGASKVKIESAGCQCCTLAMAAAFYRGKPVSDAEFNTAAMNPANFDSKALDMVYRNSFLKALGAGVTCSDDISMSLADVKKQVDSNKPLTIHFKGPTSQGYYTGSGHYALIVGYSDTNNALVLYDPGKGPGHAKSKLTYTEYTDGYKVDRISVRTYN